MFPKITDLIGAGIAWYDLYVRDRRISKEEARENRMACFLSASVSDPMMLHHLLNSIKQEEARELYRRLDSRVTHFGTILSQRDKEAYDTLVWSRTEVGRLFPSTKGRIN